MGEQQQNDLLKVFTDINSKISGLEERQLILKNRMLLIGDDLIEIKRSTNKEILEIKQSIEKVNQKIKKINQLLNDSLEEFPKFAKKRDLDILIKQAKMFQPLESTKNN